MSDEFLNTEEVEELTATEAIEKTSSEDIEVESESEDVPIEEVLAEVEGERDELKGQVEVLEETVKEQGERIKGLLEEGKVDEDEVASLKLQIEDKDKKIASMIEELNRLNSKDPHRFSGKEELLAKISKLEKRLKRARMTGAPSGMQRG